MKKFFTLALAATFLAAALTPAYAPAFIDAVKAQTGDRYVRP